MAVFEPYSPCPCGSGQKFKWCCQKVEAYAERAQRLFENHQLEPAISALHEGLKKDPNNAWLLTREAIYQLHAGRPDHAMKAVRDVLKKNPTHLGAHSLLVRLTLESEGAAAGAAQFQQALTATPPESRALLFPLAKVVASFLAEAGETPAALQHLKLAFQLGSTNDQSLVRAILSIEGKPGIPPWLKNPAVLLPPPESLARTARSRFDEAFGWANEGLWSSAGSAFETLASDPVVGPIATRNAGFCRLWTADNASAVSSIRRYLRTLGPTTEAVDLECLCQLIEPSKPDDLVEQVQLVWPLRNRAALLEKLEADPTYASEGPEPLDPSDPESALIDHFAILDRPAIKSAPADLRVDAIPRVLARVLVGADFAAIEGFDDGRLDKLSERFLAVARPAVPSAHPKTKVLDKLPAHPIALSWEWSLPDDVAPETQQRLSAEQSERVIRDIWPNTPHPSLRGRTPLQAARSGDAVVPLRAAVFQLEFTRQAWSQSFDFAGLRSQLKIDSEPAINPETVDLSTLHLARLALVPAEFLPNDKLGVLYRTSRRYGLDAVMVRASRLLIDRPGAMDELKIAAVSVYADLARLAFSRRNEAEGLDWIARGRKADELAKQVANAPYWDMLEVRFHASSTPPDRWVPELAVILERYRDNESATQLILLSLVEMGLIEVAPHPDDPNEQLLDSRPLTALLAEYGPRITTASGQLGVSAAKPEIWTPGASPGAPSAIWTPGSAAAADPSKKVIITGR